LKQEDINNLNRTITSNGTKAVINYPALKKKSPVLFGYTAEFCQTFKTELTPVLLKLFNK
jgi:hypothetical protein